LLTGRRQRDAAWLAESLRDVAPVRVLRIPSPEDTTTNRFKPDGRVWTDSATIQGRITYQGNGILVEYNGTDQYASTPDEGTIPQGNGTIDPALSLVCLANVTDTANNRVLMSKYSDTGPNREWLWRIDTTDKQSFLAYDESASAFQIRTADAATTHGVPRLFGMTYSGVGGANAANGMTLYENGALVASTATPNASYVAMEDSAAALAIGVLSIPGGGAQFGQGSFGFVAVYAAALTAVQHKQVNDIKREYYGLAA